MKAVAAIVLSGVALALWGAWWWALAWLVAVLLVLELTDRGPDDPPPVDPQPRHVGEPVVTPAWWTAGEDEGWLD